MDVKKLNDDEILDLNKILKIIIPSDQKKGLPGADEIKFFTLNSTNVVKM